MRERAGWVLCLTGAALLIGRAALAQGTGNDRCVSLINNDARKVVDARAKADKKCVRDNKGGSATACVDGADAKTDAKKAKLVSRFASSCASNPPAFGIAAGSAPAINAAAESAANDVAHDLFGASVDVGSDALGKCQEKVTQRAGQLLVTRWREFRSCKKRELSGFADAAALAAGCLGGPNGTQPDADGKISARAGKLTTAIQTNCVAKGITPASGAFPGECVGAADADLDDCIARQVACRFCESAKAADGLPNASLDCDLFDNAAVDGTCGPIPPTSTPTLTPTPTPTPTNPPTPTIPAICEPQVGLPTPIAQVPFTILPGSPQCGGTGLDPQPDPPFSGSVEDGSATELSPLGEGCLYTGGFQGIRLPSGSTAKLDVIGVSLLPPSVTLAGSAGSGPNDCTKGAGPGRHCLNGALGVDGEGSCFSDVDCGGGAGSCNLDANCFFGPPIPVFAGPVGTCIVNTFLTDLCGQVSLLPPSANLATALSSRIYVTGGRPTACPVCESGVCSYGKNEGQTCTPLGSENTSLDCPPDDANFTTALTVPIESLTTGTSSLSDGSGFFCPGQLIAGAFGVPDARTVTQTGTAPGGGSSALAMTLAATFCVPASGDVVIDFIAQLPAVGAVSAPGELDLSAVLP